VAELTDDNFNNILKYVNVTINLKTIMIDIIKRLC